MTAKKSKGDEMDDPYQVEEVSEPEYSESVPEVSEEEIIAAMETEKVSDGPVEDIDNLPEGWQVRAVDGQYHVEHLNTSLVFITDRDSILEVIDQVTNDNPEAFEPG